MKRYLDKRNGRLVYTCKNATPDFWDHHWDVKNLRESVERGKNDILLLKTIRNYVPDKKGKIWREDVVYRPEDILHVHSWI